MNELTVFKNENWTCKKDVAKSFGVDEKTIQTIVNEQLTMETTFQPQFHIKKGGYHNSQVLYDDELVNAIGLQLKKNALNAVSQCSNSYPYTIKDLSELSGLSEDYIRKEVFLTLGEIPHTHSILGGYHNTQKFYSQEVLDAIIAYQHTAHGNTKNADVVNANSQNILRNASQMVSFKTLMESGNVDAVKEYIVLKNI